MHTNSLIIKGKTETLTQVEELLKELDTEPAKPKSSSNRRRRRKPGAASVPKTIAPD
jgi:hypothetical protein